MKYDYEDAGENSEADQERYPTSAQETNVGYSVCGDQSRRLGEKELRLSVSRALVRVAWPSEAPPCRRENMPAPACGELGHATHKMCQSSADRAMAFCQC